MKKNPKRGGRREGAGRKPMGEAPQDAALIVKCRSAEKADWLAVSEATGIPISKVVRDALNGWVAKFRKSK